MEELQNTSLVGEGLEGSEDVLAGIQFSLDSLKANADTFFLIVMACLIFFMQCGFAFLEAGSVRSKNTTNILIKNVLDVCLGAFAYWAVGYAFAFGPGNAFLGHRYFFFENMPPSLYSHWFFHFVFAATATTIVSGAMAERTEFGAYLIYSCVITGVIYPIVSHWAWSGNGWLAAGPGVEGVAYQDFAGSGVVHMVGGMAALVGAAIVGPRLGRFDKQGNPTTIPGHTVPLAALGGFILFFGFFAFNGGSQASISQPGDGEVVAVSIVNTIISGGHAALVAMVIKKLKGFNGQWSLLITINGALTGMVAICAGCNVLAPWGAAVVGIVSGAVYVLWSWLVCKLRIDDPLDAVAVHLGGGLWGVFSVPILGFETGVVFAWNQVAFMNLGWNALGAVAIICWTGILSAILFGLMRLLGVLRVSSEIEEKGLDIAKHGESAYPLSSYGHGWSSEANLIEVRVDGKGSAADLTDSGSASSNAKDGCHGILPAQVYQISQTESSGQATVGESANI
ncbi:putative ammonium transporter 1 [Acanthaster planci]|uniref:Ammonium transporter n=1 Tax=Acanthaster planci TaxID=133434 RepID=A0A8B7XR60_ACAPL|nr:putative ammonium transporter 1 [Acanthaster planci]